MDHPALHVYQVKPLTHENSSAHITEQTVHPSFVHAPFREQLEAVARPDRA
jgi:hypothetical protein